MVKKLYLFFLSIKNIFIFFLINEEFKKIVLYSENQIYKYYFYPLIELLIKKKQKFIYLKSDFNDKLNNDNIRDLYIGDGFAFLVITNFLNCKNLIMTLTDLNNNKFKKSPFCKNYIYIFHSLVSTHKYYTEHAFNNYDKIFCCGQYQINEILKNEEVHNLKNKVLVNTGYLFLDYLDAKIKERNFALTSKKILFATTWNKDMQGLTNTDLNSIFESLLQKYQIIFRPHPEDVKRNKIVINQIADTYKNNPNFFLDVNSENFKSLEESCLLITDAGGIFLEYLFAFKKPVIFLEGFEKVHNPNFKSVFNQTFEEKIRSKFCLSINKDNFKEIDNYISSCLSKNFLDDMKKKLKENENLFANRGKVAEIIYKNLNI